LGLANRGHLWICGILGKLGVSNRTEAAAAAVRLGWDVLRAD
jgi:DNA-binding NarL/FixJ family response regulator